MTPRPIIFLSCFDALEDLKQVQDEQYAIFQQIRDLRFETDLLVESSRAQDSDWMQAIAHCQQKGKILIFHFAGHARPDSLLFEEKDGDKVQMFVKPLANLLKVSPPFLVFLNGCRTYGFVEGLMEVGVSVVIATNVDVPDGIAQSFATLFYSQLAKGQSIEQAFAFASSQPDTKERLSKVYRAGGLHATGLEKEACAWLMYSRSTANLAWRLTQNLKKSVKKPTRYLSTYHEIDISKIVGRKRGLFIIDQLLSSHRRALLVNGLGGIGKTTLAKYYVQEYEAQYNHIIWVDVLPEEGQAGGNVVNAFVSEYNQVLNRTGLSLNPRMADQQKFYQLMTHLSNEVVGHNLLVLDNVGDTIADIQRHLPKSANWDILVTSRRHYDSFVQYKIETLPEEDAIQLFLNHYSKGEGNALLPLLLQRIGFHTLTIELIAKTLAKHPRLTLTKLWESLDKEGLQAANRMKVRVSHPQFRKAIKANDCVKQLFDMVKLTEKEQQLLLQFAVLPSMAIPFDTLVELLGIDEAKEDDFIELLSGLVQRGWLRQEEEGYVCHQIIQEVIRQYTPPTVDRCKELILSLTEKLHINDVKDNPVDKFQWLPYGEGLAQWIEGSKEEVIEFLNCLGYAFYHRGEYNRSTNLLEKVLCIAEKLYGKGGKNIGRYLNNLALMYEYQGRDKEAKDMYEQSLALELKHFGSDHPRVAIRRSNLGNVLHSLGDYDGAKKELERALALAIRHFGRNHPRVAIRRSNLGNVLRSLGDYDGAKKEIEQALTLELNHFGTNHPMVAISHSNLGSVLRCLGDYEGAKRELEKALALAVRHYGEKHPRAAIRYSNLAWVYENTGELEQALIYFEKAFSIRLQSLGETHPYTKGVIQSITRIKSKLNLS